MLFMYSFLSMNKQIGIIPLDTRTSSSLRTEHVFVGHPFLVMEFAMGQAHQSGDIVSFGSVHPRMRGIGLASVYGAFVVGIYYNALLAWSLIYLVFSITKSPLPWTASSEDASTSESLDVALDFFLNKVLHLGDQDDSTPGIVWPIFVAYFFIWVLIFLSIFKGVNSTSKVVYITMPVPILMLIILFFRGITLEGASSGLAAYLGNWDMSYIANGTMWSSAISQIFFSIGVTFGTMTAYASYNSKGHDIIKDALIVSIADFSVSIFAGVVVFCILGYLSTTSGIPIDSLPVSGPALVFITYPVALSKLSGSNFWCFLFFLTLIFLGIDSAFSLIEAVTTCLNDSRRFKTVSRFKITLATCIIGFLLGLMYTTRNGLYFLDAVDFFINNINMVMIGIFETLACGWLYALNEQIRVIGFKAVSVFTITYFGSIILGICVAISAWDSSPTGGFLLGVCLAVFVFGLGYALSIELANTPPPETGSKQYWILFYPADQLRKDLNEACAAAYNLGTSQPQTKPHTIGFLWVYAIRLIAPATLICVLALTISDLISADGYGGYNSRIVGLGAAASIGGVALLWIALVFPKLLENLLPDKGAQVGLPHDIDYGQGQTRKLSEPQELAKVEPLEQKE